MNWRLSQPKAAESRPIEPMRRAVDMLASDKAFTFDYEGHPAMPGEYAGTDNGARLFRVADRAFRPTGIVWQLAPEANLSMGSIRLRYRLTGKPVKAFLQFKRAGEETAVFHKEITLQPSAGDSFMEHRLAIGSVDLSGVTEAVLLLAAIPTVVAREPFDLRVLSFRVVPPVSGARMSDADQRTASKRLSQLEKELAALTQNWRSDGLTLVQAVRRELRATGPRTVHTRRASHIADHLEQMFLTLEPSTGRQHPQAGSGLAALTRRELVERLNLTYTEDDWSDNTLQVLQTLTAIDGKTPAPKLKELIDHATVWTPRDLKILNALPRFVRAAQNGSVNAATMKRFGERVLGSSGESVRQRVQRSAPIRKAWKLAQRLAADAIAVRARADRRRAQGKILLDRQKLPAPGAAFVVEIARRLERQNTRRSRPAVITDRAVAAYILKNAQPWKSARQKPSITSLQTQIAKRFVQKNWNPEDVGRMGKIRDEYVAIKTRSGNAWAVEGVRRGQKNRAAGQLPLDGDASGARMSQLQDRDHEPAGTRRLIALPIPRFIPLVRAAIAEQVYQRLSGIGEAMGLDEVYFSNMVRRILETGELKLALMRSVYHVRQKSAADPRGRIVQKIKIYPQFLGWQERWYRTWADAARSEPDAAKRLRMMSMAEFLGDMGSESARESAGITPEDFVRGREQAYRGLSEAQPDLLPPTVQYVEIPMAGGAPIPARLILPNGVRAGPTPIAIIYHGFGMSGDSSYFDELEQNLIKRGVAVLRPDLLSHGRSHRAMGNKAVMKDYNDAIAAYLISRADVIDPSRTAIYGFSFGGYLALRAAIQSDLGRMIRSLVLMNPPTGETFSRSRIFQWHEGLLRELFPVKDFQRLVDKAASLRIPLHEFVAARGEKQFANMGANTLILLSDQDETIHFRDQAEIREFAERIGARVVTMEGQGHFAVGSALHAAYTASADHIARMLKPADAAGARMAHLSRGNEPPAEWFRKAVAFAAERNGVARIITVCTANYHRSAALEWALGVEADIRGWDRIALDSGGTAWWQGNIPGFASAWDTLLPSLKNSFNVSQSEEMVAAVRTYLFGPGSAVNRSSALTDEEIGSLYHSFDPDRWRSLAPLENAERWSLLGDEIAQMIWDADLDLAGSIRLDNTGFKAHAREVAGTYRPSPDDAQRLVSRQEIYDHPKPIARRTLLDADVILAASEHHRAAIVRLAPEVAGRIVTLRELDPRAFDHWFKGTDIPDPGQGQIDEFNLVRALWPSVQRLLHGLDQSATLLQGKPFAELIATEVRLRHIHEMIKRYLLGSEAGQFGAGGSSARAELTARELQDPVRLKAHLDWDQEQLEHNYRRSSDLAAELGSLVDEAEKSLADAETAAKSDHEKLWIRKLKIRLVWLRARIAEGWLDRGEYLRARYVWGQVSSRAVLAGVGRSPRILQLNRKFATFEAYKSARQFLVQGDLSHADEQIAIYQRAVSPNDPALTYLVAFRTQLEDRLRALGSEAPVQPAPRAPPVDEKLWMAGKAVSVHETPIDTRLVVKRALSASNDQEADALRMTAIAAREGFTIESYGGYWLTRVLGFAPFAYLNSSIMLQKKLEKTLQPIDPAQIASSLQSMQATLLMKHTLEDRGILWLDPKPENIGFDVVDPSAPDGASPLWTPVLLDFGFVYPIGDPPAKGARMALTPGKNNSMMLALSALDTAATVNEDPTRPLVMQNGFEKAERLLPSLAERGIGHLYLYGTADIGSSSGSMHDSFSSRVHTVPDRGAHDVWSKDGRVAVRVEGYEVRRETRPDGRTLDDAPGNIFSVMSLKDLHPGMGAPGDEQNRLRRKLRHLTQKAGSLGIKVILDFIPWRSPEAVNESNYKNFFYKELSADANRDYQAIGGDEAARRAWISRLLEHDKVGFVAVRVRENGAERVVLVRRFNFYGMNSADQVIMNPYHPETHRYFVESLKAMVDAGVAGVRVDLGHLLLPKHIRRYFDEVELLLRSRGETMESWLRASGEDIRPDESYAAWWERRNAGSLPWRQILAEVGSYAEQRGQRFQFIIEAYDENDRNELRALGVDGSYKKPLFDMLKRLIDHPNMKVWEIERELFTVIDEKPSAVVFPSNFDQLSLIKMGGAIPAVQMLMVSLGAIQVPVIQDFREWTGQEGHLVKVPGGNNNPRDPDHHPFATDAEIRQRIASPQDWQSESLARSAWADMQEAVQRATGGAEAEDIRILNNSHRDRYLTFAWRANGRWFLSVSDFRAAQGKEGAADVLKVEMPAFMGLHGFDPSLLTAPKAVVGADKILGINIGSWSREAVAGAATWDIEMRPSDAGATVDHTCFVDLGPAKPAPIRDVPHRLDQVLLEPYVYERQKELEDIIKSSVSRELKRDAFFMALLDHHHLLRAMAANAAAGRFEGMKPIPVNADELLGFVHDPLEVFSRLETRRSWWPGVGEYYNDVRARRNGRYAMVHTLRFLKIGSDANLLPRKTSGLAQNAIKLLRKRLRADASRWSPAQEIRIRQLINEEVQVALQGHTNADQDVSIGKPAQMTELELMRMIVVRADIVRQNMTPEGRDIFYWLLDAVQTLVPDEAGDPVADVVYRGKVPVTGARMAQVAALSVGEHASKNEDAYLSMDLGNGWQVLGVFDGMGGEFDGAEASRRANNAVQKFFTDGMSADQQALLKRFKLELGDDTDARISALMVAAFVKAREAVQEIETPKGSSSGTTFTLALVRQIDRRAPVAWVLTHGDSMAAVWDPLDPAHLMPVPGAYQMYDLNPAILKKEQERRAVLAEIDDPKIGAIDAFSDEIERTHHKTYGLDDDDLPLIREEYLGKYGAPGSEAAGFTLDEAEAWIFRRMTIGLTNLHEDAFPCAPPMRVEIPAGGTLILATDGVWDNLRHSEAAQILADEAEGRRTDIRTLPMDKKLQDAAAALYNRSVLPVHPGPERIPRARYKPDDITVVLYGRNWPAIDRTALEWQRIIRPAADRYTALNGAAKPTIAQLAVALAQPNPPVEYKKLIHALKARPQAKRYEKSLRAIFRHHHPTLQPEAAGLEAPRTTLTTKEWNKIFAQALDDAQLEVRDGGRPVTLDDLYRNIQKRHPEWRINKLRTQAYRLGMTKKGRAERYAPRADSGAYDSWLRRLIAIKKRIPKGDAVTTNALSAASQKTTDRLSVEEVRRAISSHPRLRGALQIQDARASNRFHRVRGESRPVKLEQLLFGKDRDIARARRVISRMESTADAWHWYVLDQVIGLAGERPGVLNWSDLMHFVYDDLGLEPRFVESALEVWRKKFERSGARMADARILIVNTKSGAKLKSGTFQVPDGTPAEGMAWGRTNARMKSVIVSDAQGLTAYLANEPFDPQAVIFYSYASPIEAAKASTPIDLIVGSAALFRAAGKELPIVVLKGGQPFVEAEETRLAALQEAGVIEGRKSDPELATNDAIKADVLAIAFGRKNWVTVLRDHADWKMIARSRQGHHLEVRFEAQKRQLIFTIAPSESMPAGHVVSLMIGNVTSDPLSNDGEKQTIALPEPIIEDLHAARFRPFATHPNIVLKADPDSGARMASNARQMIPSLTNARKGPERQSYQLRVTGAVDMKRKNPYRNRLQVFRELPKIEIPSTAGNWIGKTVRIDIEKASLTRNWIIRIYGASKTEPIHVIRFDSKDKKFIPYTEPENPSIGDLKKIGEKRYTITVVGKTENGRVPRNRFRIFSEASYVEIPRRHGNWVGRKVDVVVRPYKNKVGWWEIEVRDPLGEYQVLHRLLLNSKSGKYGVYPGAVRSWNESFKKYFTAQDSSVAAPEVTVTVLSNRDLHIFYHKGDRASKGTQEEAIATVDNEWGLVTLRGIPGSDGQKYLEVLEPSSRKRMALFRYQDGSFLREEFIDDPELARLTREPLRDATASRDPLDTRILAAMRVLAQQHVGSEWQINDDEIMRQSGLQAREYFVRLKRSRLVDDARHAILGPFRERQMLIALGRQLRWRGDEAVDQASKEWIAGKDPGELIGQIILQLSGPAERPQDVAICLGAIRVLTMLLPSSKDIRSARAIRDALTAPSRIRKKVYEKGRVAGVNFFESIPDEFYRSEPELIRVRDGFYDQIKYWRHAHMFDPEARAARRDPEWVAQSALKRRERERLSALDPIGTRFRRWLDQNESSGDPDEDVLRSIWRQMKRAKRTEEPSFERLAPILIREARLVSRALGSEIFMDDLISEGFLLIHEGLSVYDGKGSLGEHLTSHLSHGLRNGVLTRIRLIGATSLNVPSFDGRTGRASRESRIDEVEDWRTVLPGESEDDQDASWGSSAAHHAAARMAEESMTEEPDGIPTEEWEPVASQQVVFNAQHGMHGRPSNVVVTMAQHIEQHGRQLMHSDLRVQIRREQKTARGISLLQIMGLGIRDQDSIEIGIAGDIDDAAAETIVDIFAEMLRDRDLLGHGGYWRESLQRYYDRVDQAMVLADTPTISGDLLGSFGLGGNGLQSGVLGQFLTDVIRSHPSENRAHVAVETANGAVAIFCVWRDGREVWYALKGQAGRMRIESAEAMDLHTGAYSGIADLGKSIGVEQVKKLDPASAVALDLSLAEGLLRAARQFAGADIGRQPVLANVELDVDDLLARVGAADDGGDRARILKNLKSLQARIRDEGFGRLLFRGDPDALPDAPTARLYRKDNLAYAASAAPGTIRWAYTQDQDQILPVLSSTILSALLAAAPIEGRDGYLDALTPLYQRLTGSADRLTAALLEEARSNPDRLMPIKPLSLRGYLDTAVYLQELARKSAAVAA